LHILAQSMPNSKVVAAWDARMGQVYLGRYIADQQGILQPQTADEMCYPTAITLEQPEQWHAVGNAWSVYADSIPSKVTADLLSVDSTLYPHAKAMLVLADHALPSDYVRATQLRPVYLRRAVAS
jgi:tRNA threonylcarbamoyladenosine biosynthesis protein TsaB